MHDNCTLQPLHSPNATTHEYTAADDLAEMMQLNLMGPYKSLYICIAV